MNVAWNDDGEDGNESKEGELSDGLTTLVPVVCASFPLSINIYNIKSWYIYFFKRYMMTATSNKEIFSSCVFRCTGGRHSHPEPAFR